MFQQFRSHWIRRSPENPFSGAVKCPLFLICQNQSHALERQGYYEVEQTTGANAPGYLRNGYC